MLARRKKAQRKRQGRGKKKTPGRRRLFVLFIKKKPWRERWRGVSSRKSSAFPACRRSISHFGLTL